MTAIIAHESQHCRWMKEQNAFSNAFVEVSNTEFKLNFSCSQKTLHRASLSFYSKYFQLLK